MKSKLIILLLLVSMIVVGCQQNDVQTNGEINEVDQSNTETEYHQKSNKEQEPKKEIEDTADKEANNSQDNSNGSENNNAGSENSGKRGNEEQSEIVHGKLEQESGLVVVDNPDSVEVLVNKQRKLPDGYKPNDLVVPDIPFYFQEYLPKKQMRKEAAAALEELFAGASENGVELLGASGYRSYETQKFLYERYVAVDGQEAADRYSARPGTSEHQTGLTIDLTSAQMAFALEQSFIDTDEGSWLAENAHNYGFIIRYPEGKEHITGYMYEPWHIRYVGKEIAKEVYENNLTLEEYFGYGY